ncbi:MAG: hypothetical protein ACLVJH_11235 [Faecalibacterium prausnitzii]
MHSLLGLTAAIPILLGDNIGTTITAVLAAIGQEETPSGWRQPTPFLT